MHLFENPTFWVAVSFIALVALLWRKVAVFLGSSFDSRAARIRHELQEAAQLRAEADSLLASFLEKKEHYGREAEQILLDAREDAASLAAVQQAELKTALVQRQKLAKEKIERLERQALAEVRTQIVDTALETVKTQLASRLGEQQTPMDEASFQAALHDVQQALKPAHAA